MSAQGNIILAIVEGPSDATALVDPLSKLLRNSQLRDLIADGDITLRYLYAKSHPGMTGSNMEKVMTKLIDADIKRRHVYVRNDVTAVIQILDLDGAFVPDGHVSQDEGLEERRYTENSILTPNAMETIRQNHEKQKNIRSLISMKDIRLGRRDVPFHSFYMSRNLEHVIWDEKKQLEPEGKSACAKRAFRRYVQHPEELLDLLRSPEVMHGFKSFEESWNWPQVADNSLARGSNLGFLLDVLDPQNM